MKNNVFQILKDMNKQDIENGNKTVQLSNIFLRARKVKQGAEIVMGVPEENLLELMRNDVFAVLLIIDKKDYEQRFNQ